MVRVEGAPAWLDPADALEAFDLLDESVAVFDRDARIRHVNAASERIFRRRREELVGRVLWESFPELAGSDLQAAFLRVAATARPEILESRFPPWDRWYQHRLSPCRGGVLIFARDVTDERRAREQLEALARGSRLIAESVVGSPEPYQAVARAFAEVLHDTCAVRLLRDDGTAETVAYHHPVPEAMRAFGELLLGWRAPATAGLSGPVFAGGRPVLHAVAPCEGQLGADRPELAALMARNPARSLIAVPLREGGRVFGALVLARFAAARSYDEADLALAGELADRAALALINARLLDEQRRARDEAERLAGFTAALVACVTVAEVSVRAAEAARVATGARAAKAWLAGDAGAPIAEAERRGGPWVDGARAYLPLFAGERCAGVVELSGGAIDGRLLAAMAATAASALERCRTFNAEREARAAAMRSAARSARLLAATAALTSARGSQAVAHELIRIAAEALDARAGFVGVVAAGASSVEIIATRNVPREQLDEWRKVPVARTLIGEVVAGGRALWLESDEAVRERSPGARARAAQILGNADGRCGALLIKPLRVAADLSGALVLVFDGPRRFDGDERELIVAMTALASQALDRARLFEAEAQARRAVEAANAKLEAIIIATPTPVIMLDADDRVELWNPAAEATFGWSAAEVLGRKNPIVPDAREQEFGQLRSSLSAGRSVRGHETTRVRRDGSLIEVVIWAAPVNVPDGTQHYLAVIVDVSERRRAEEALREADRRKDEFLALLGHELRNPLAPILTAVELLRLRDGGAPSREVATIERQARHLVALVDDLLDVARITRGKITLRREPLELASIVMQALETTSTLIEQRRHTVEVDVPRRGAVVNGDLRRLVQVLANLLTNSATYTEPGGRIAVRARLLDGAAEIAVSDSGAGFSAELVPRIFEPFVQGHRDRGRLEGGLGLGLALVRSLVELHGGTVRGESPGSGQGSTFTVTLPLAPAGARVAASPAPPPVLSSSDPGRAATRILVVDDNEDAAELLAEALKAAGHDVLAAFGPTEALRCVESFTPDVAVLDVGMPVMDGYELGARLRARFGAALRLVAVTGYGQDADHARSREAGFQAHLVKPVDLAALLDAAIARG